MYRLRVFALTSSEPIQLRASNIGWVSLSAPLILQLSLLQLLTYCSPFVRIIPKPHSLGLPYLTTDLWLEGTWPTLLALPLLPSPEFIINYCLGLGFTLFNTKYLHVAGGEAIDWSCPWLVLGREAKGYLTPCYWFNSWKLFLLSHLAWIQGAGIQ